MLECGILYSLTYRMVLFRTNALHCSPAMYNWAKWRHERRMQRTEPQSDLHPRKWLESMWAKAVRKLCTTICNGCRENIEKKHENQYRGKQLQVCKCHSLFLEHDVFVGFQVAHINFFPILQYLWMFTWHQPTNMTEEKSTIRIMRIRISVRILVMLSMITNPYI